ncbi:MAG: hypothetical protein M1818_000702 [Claussenomyces sp. TS43310]|nr:MAG: hypothetical protein M1818_000702 [Claussenomyces sp. TS43310]
MPNADEEALLSSPDPLIDLPNCASPAKSRSSNQTRKSISLGGKSPRKQTFQLDVGNQLSPQKIRVTVEADGSDKENGPASHQTKGAASRTNKTPFKRRNEYTTTTTVRVKGLSDSEDDTEKSPVPTPKRGRGRPKRSGGTPVPANPRTRRVTPGAKQGGRRRTIGDLIDGDDDEDWDFAIGAGVEIGRGKGRSRSRSIKESSGKGAPGFNISESPQRGAVKAVSNKGKGRRRTLAPEEVPMPDREEQDIPNVNLENSPHAGSHGSGGWVSMDDSNAHSTSGMSYMPGRTSPHVAPVLLLQHSRSVPEKDLSSASGNRLNVNNVSLSQDSPVPQHTGGKLGNGATVELGGAPEFDTILEDEGFSMISVESVPSLRAHLSSPAPQDRSSITSTPNRSTQSVLTSAKATGPSAASCSFQRLSNPKLSSVRAACATEAEDSFSSIPSDILQAVTPGKHAQNSRLLALKAQDEDNCDDSFSSIPSAVLDAATPAKHRSRSISSTDTPYLDERSAVTESVVFATDELSLKATHADRELSRLITPDETPPPNVIGTGSGDEHLSHEPSHVGQHNLAADSERSIEGSSIVMRSSPPTVGSHGCSYTAPIQADCRAYSTVNKTPSIIFSSPSLPPQIQQALPRNTAPDSHANPKGAARSGLLPIVRAGQALQDITVPSASSRDRSPSLGSPFRSPVAQRRPTSGPESLAKDGANPKISAEEARHVGLRPEDDRFKVFSSGTRRELRLNYMMGAKIATVKERVASIDHEDPFSTGPTVLRAPSPEDKDQYSLGLPGENQALHSTKHKENRSSAVRSSNVVSPRTNTGSPSRLPTPDATDSPNCAEGNNMEPDLWQTAAENPPLRDQKEVWSGNQETKSTGSSQMTAIDLDKTESPFDKVYEDDAASTSPQENFDLEEDIWMVEAQHSSSVNEEPEPVQAPLQSFSEKPRRSKIPSPWRKNSKRLVYSDELAQLPSSPSVRKEMSIIPQQRILEKRSSPEPVPVTQFQVQGSEESEIAEELSMLQSIPQKSHFAPRVRPREKGNLDLSALFASSPAKTPQVLTAETQNAKTPEEHEFSSIIQRPSFSGQAIPSRNSPEQQSYSWDTDDLVEGSTFQQPASPDASQSELSASNEEPTAEGSSTLSSILNDADLGAEAVQAPISLSPRKSCLRTSLPNIPSPSKSVVFVGLSSSPSTSSTNTSTSTYDSSITTPTPTPTPTPSLVPQSQRAPPPPTLSPTTWSKSHWKLLNRIYQDAKRCPVPPPGSCTSDLLGKAVRARGAKLVLTEWHLDIVACFRDEVPGWAEDVVVRRLFGLVVDEQTKARVPTQEEEHLGNRGEGT